jgi:acetyl esterase
MDDADAFIRACVRGDLRGACSSLERGTSVDRRDGFGYTALGRVAEDWRDGHGGISPSSAVAALLLARGANINAGNPSHDGWTPLHLAAWSGKAGAVRFLLAHGGDVAAKDWFGQTPLQVALQSSRQAGGGAAAAALRKAAGVVGDRGPLDAEWTVADMPMPQSPSLATRTAHLFTEIVYSGPRWLHDVAMWVISPSEAKNRGQGSVVSTNVEYPVDFCKRDKDAHDRAPGQTLTARLYTPAAFASTAPATGKAPLILHIHSGGWTILDAKIVVYDRYCRQLCRRLGAFVLSINYRLAPEHPFPAAPNDCFGCLSWLGTPGSLAVVPAAADRRRIAITGDSAGGNLTAVTCLMYRDLHPQGVSVLHQGVVYPCTFKRPLTASRSHTALQHASVLSQARMAWFEEQYRGAERSAEDMARTPYVNPEAAVSLSGSVPTSGIICGADVLRDEGVSYFRALRAAGSEVDWRQWDEAPHGLFALEWDTRAVEAKSWLVGRLARALDVEVQAKEMGKVLSGEPRSRL